MQIGVNGVISFGGEVHNSPQAFGNLFSSEGTSYVIAPFWSNNDIRRDGRVRYEVYDGSTTASIDVLNRISNLIASGSGEAFQGTWMLLVEWENCHPYPHGQSSQPVDSYLQQVCARYACGNGGQSFMERVNMTLYTPIIIMYCRNVCSLEVKTAHEYSYCYVHHFC